MKYDEFSHEIWNRNYRAEGEATVEDTWRRIAKNVAMNEENPELWEDVYFNMLKGFKVIPGGRISSNIGAERKSTTLMNCYVMHPKEIGSKDIDSIEFIYDFLKKQAHTLKSEGGIGINFSWLRPNGTYVKGIGNRTPGPLKFMEIYDKSSEIVTSGASKIVGKKKRDEKNAIRKGAQMGVLNCFSKTTNILTEEYGELNILRLFKKLEEGETIHAMDSIGDSHKISNPIIKDAEYLFTITTVGGYTLVTTLDHKYEVMDLKSGKVYLKAIKDIDIEYERLKIVSVEEDGYSATYKKMIGMEVLGFEESYDFSVEDTHRILAKDTHSEEGVYFYTSNCWHPDIKDFIKVKQFPNKLTKFNLSVGITDGFMETLNETHEGEHTLLHLYKDGINVKDIMVSVVDMNICLNDVLIDVDGLEYVKSIDFQYVRPSGHWTLMFPDTNDKNYSEWNGIIEEWLRDGGSVIQHEFVKSNDLWDLIMESTYNRNEPGVLFLDVANKLNPTSYCEVIQTSNPCGEITMGSGVCNLGSINLSQFIIKNDDENKSEFNFDKLRKHVQYGVRFLDNINDISNVPLDLYKEQMLKMRRIGLGLSGVGSALLMMNMRYGGKESIGFLNKLCKLKCETELLTSALLGKEKGSFKAFDKEKYFNTLYWRSLNIDPLIKAQIEDIGCMRNSHHSANAPQGNSSIYANVISGGIEPVFELSYTRWINVTTDNRMKLIKEGYGVPSSIDEYLVKPEEYSWLKIVSEYGEKILIGSVDTDEYKFTANRGLTIGKPSYDYGYRWLQENYTKDFIDINKENGVYDTATMLTVGEHLTVLSIVNDWIDMNSSKTVNVPANYNYEDFKTLYDFAWRADIKGLTTYRAGTMLAVLEKKKEIEEYQSELDELLKKHGDKVIVENVKLPEEYNSKGYSFKDKNGTKWFINVAFADSGMQKPFALFIKTNGRVPTDVADVVISDMEELLINSGVNVELIEKQRKKYNGQNNVDKCARAIGMCLRHNVAIKDIVEVIEKHPDGFSTLLFFTKKLLSKFIKDGTTSVKKCPTCTENLIYNDGCVMCTSCGYSACS